MRNDTPDSILRKIEIVGRLYDEGKILKPVAEEKQKELLDRYLEDETRKGIQVSEDKGRRFKIALSFPGEKRAFVYEVANALCQSHGQESVFYDEHFKAELARVDLDTYLQSIYHDHSELIVVFLCKEYNIKEWCGLEWRSIRDLIRQRKTSNIMLFRFDATEIPGLFTTDGYVLIGDHSPQKIAELISQRYELNRQSH